MAVLSGKTSRLLPRHTFPRIPFPRSRISTKPNPTEPSRVYISRSKNPYLNLATEHHLLQTAHPGTTTLFLYTNKPCIVLGRNQNPWLEVNLPLLHGGVASSSDSDYNVDAAMPMRSHDGEEIHLVRRRSGGGTVFHDEGNVNWSIICPRDGFNRNYYAEMVVRALQSLGVAGAKVNCRHDIVLANTSGTSSDPEIFKVSGSAYKLTRQVALHHGTCLLNSPYLSAISKLLRSPAEPFIKALGADSVRSRIANTGVSNDDFEYAVIEEFKGLATSDIQVEVLYPGGNADAMQDSGTTRMDISGEVAELMDPGWVFGQTPRFTLSTYPYEGDTRERPVVPFEVSVFYAGFLPSNEGTMLTI
jgi:lipoate---protein ligase